jgi:hypothetical protein
MNCLENETKECEYYLIGIIDSLSFTKNYCPDGNTSYGYLIDSYRRYSKNKGLQDSDTYLLMQFTIWDLKLGCK